MQTQVKINNYNLDKKKSEQVLVIPRKILSKYLCQKGISKIDQTILQKIVEDKVVFMPRERAEVAPEFKQIIPYLVFNFNKTLFLTRRRESSSEQRLAGKFSLGIGGHLRKNDLVQENIFGWAQREFLEEVDFKGLVKPNLIGLINDESNSVGQVHTGIFWLVKVDNPQIQVKEELACGTLATVRECLSVYQNMESWSQLVIDHLKQNSELLIGCNRTE